MAFNRLDSARIGSTNDRHNWSSDFPEDKKASHDSHHNWLILSIRDNVNAERVFWRYKTNVENKLLMNVPGSTF
ncbi:hypothetical protein SAMN04488090_0709 [Siphonobacter aquaeclarae]|uniref:Uncharacterized protein n=1 Tax=Siphonobacter aquaeclarae TaxID=563176 RepID=A0A1G9JR49_9BACT|nr:hypothetical protein SAMN04488090_0709 [Siphonobacter aquaeclarae]